VGHEKKHVSQVSGKTLIAIDALKTGKKVDLRLEARLLFVVLLPHQKRGERSVSRVVCDIYGMGVGCNIGCDRISSSGEQSRSLLLLDSS
jgi:hypothetical protein